MKILHINDHYRRVGGAETVLFNWLEALEEKGITNVVVHQHPVGGEPDNRRVYRVANLGEASSYDGAAVAARFREILKEERPDIVHLYDIGNPDIAEISLRFGPTLQSAFNHSFYCPGGAKYLPFLGRVCARPFGIGCLACAFITHCNSIRPRALLKTYRRSYRMMKHSRRLVFMALSRYQADCLIRNGRPPALVKVLPPFTPAPELNDRDYEHRSQNLLLFTGRIFPQKGLNALIGALKHVKSSFRLIVDGDGPDAGKARKLASELGLEGRVEFVGWAPREEHIAYYRYASIVIVPSLWPEPFGMVGIEAMSYAKPVVAFDVGGIPEWLEDGATGYLIKPYDVKQMAQRIDYLLNNPSAAREMGMKGRKKVEAEFGKEKHITKLLEIYREVIDGRIQPS